MGLLSKKNTPLVGVDISSSAVKLLQLSRSGDRYRVEYYGVEPLPANAVVEKTIKEVDRVSSSIAKAVKRSGVKTRNAATAVSGSAVITKFINMPADLTEEELEHQLSMDANQYIPYPIEEVSLDFNVLGPAEQPEMVNVLLACSRSENVDVCVEALEGAGLTPRVVDVEAYAVENAYSTFLKDQLNIDNNEVVALFDIGATTTSLHALHQGRSIYTREQSFGGKQLTEEIMRRYGLSYEEAGLAKRQGGLPESYETEVLQAFNNALIQQISRSLQFFFSATDFSNVDRILLAGGSASIPGIDSLVEEQIGVPVQVVDPLANIGLASRINKDVIKADSPALLTALGLALRSFD